MSAIQDIGLELGQPAAILGLNGAGKTSLINMLTTMIRQFSGQAFVADSVHLKNMRKEFV